MSAVIPMLSSTIATITSTRVNPRAAGPPVVRRGASRPGSAVAAGSPIASRRLRKARRPRTSPRAADPANIAGCSSGISPWDRASLGRADLLAPPGVGVLGGPPPRSRSCRVGCAAAHLDSAELAHTARKAGVNISAPPDGVRFPRRHLVCETHRLEQTRLETSARKGEGVVWNLADFVWHWAERWKAAACLTIPSTVAGRWA